MEKVVPRGTIKSCKSRLQNDPGGQLIHDKTGLMQKTEENFKFLISIRRETQKDIAFINSELATGFLMGN